MGVGEDNDPAQPAVGVTWYQALDYCYWIGGQLPTEVEWEYAARGPEGLVYPRGDVFDGHLLNSRDASCPAVLGTESLNDGYALQVPKQNHSSFLCQGHLRKDDFTSVFAPDPGCLPIVSIGTIIFCSIAIPYTEALLSAAPRPDPLLRRKGERIRLSGKVADPANPPAGCYFHPRCSYAQERCRTERPKLHNMGDEHYVACHRAAELAASSCGSVRAWT